MYYHNAPYFRMCYPILRFGLSHIGQAGHLVILIYRLIGFTVCIFIEDIKRL